MYEAHGDSYSGGGEGATWCRPGRGRDPWADVQIALVAPVGWTLAELRAGIAELERARRQSDAAMALLVGAMPSDRDSTTDLARQSQISGREARRRREVADVAKKMPEALNKLGSGEISAEHVAALAPVADLEGAAKLLDGAGEEPPEKLARKVEQFKMSRDDGWDTAKRQWARRSVRFYTTNDGMLGLTGLLPPVVGNELKMRLETVMDARWRAEHPERADTLGGHGGEGREQRLADALFDLTGCTSHGNTWPKAKPNKSSATPFTDRTGDPSEAGDPSRTRGSTNTNGPAGTRGSTGIRGPIGTNRPTTGTSDATSAGVQPGPADARETSPPEATSRGSTPHEPTTLAAAERESTASESTTSESTASESTAPEATSTGATSLGVSLRTDKPSVVITFNVDQWQAQLLGGGAIPITETLFDQARFSLYYAFTNMHGEILKFGRARRDPTPLQKLAVMARDQKCVYPGCFVPANRTEIHHVNEYAKDSGTTDVDTLVCLCPRHHQHIHLNNLIIHKAGDGTIKIIERSTGKTIAAEPRSRSA